MEPGELLFSPNRVETEIGKLVFERGGDFRRFLRRAVDQEEAIAFLIWKQLLKVRLRHQQFALKDAVGERGDHAEPDRRAVTRVDRQFVSELQMQNVTQRIGVGGDRNRALAQIRVEQDQGVGLLPIGLRQRRLKREPRFADEAVGRAEYSRVARLVKIQTTGVVARAQPEPRDLHARQLILDEVQLFSALLAVQVVNDRKQRFGHQRITAGARISVGRSRAAVPPKGVNRNDDEGRRSD